MTDIYRLLKIAENVSSACNTISYALYFLAACKDGGSPIRDNLHALIDGDLADVRATNEELASASPLAAIAGQFYKIRSILRLFRLIPQLNELLQLLRNPGPDRLLWVTEVIESSLFATHQVFDGLAALVDFQILPRGLQGVYGGDSMVIYNLAYRTWLLAVSCRFIRTFRWTKHDLEHRFGIAHPQMKGMEEPDHKPKSDPVWLCAGFPSGGRYRDGPKIRFRV